MKSGIYAIVNKLSGRKYIGSSRDLDKRKRGHFSTLRRGCHHNVWLQRSHDKHGPKAFQFVILEECKPADLFSREKFHIENEKLCEAGIYNIGSVGGGDNTSSHPLNHEIRERISKSQMGKKMKPRYGEENPNWRGGYHYVKSVGR